jgi:hypothetical protein
MPFSAFLVKAFKTFAFALGDSYSISGSRMLVGKENIGCFHWPYLKNPFFCMIPAAFAKS